MSDLSSHSCSALRGSRAVGDQGPRLIGGVGLSGTAGVPLLFIFFSPPRIEKVAPAWFLMGSCQVATIGSITAAIYGTTASANLITPQITR